jgi:hypothetical protein
MRMLRTYLFQRYRHGQPQLPHPSSYRTLRSGLSCSKSPAEKLTSNQSRVWDGRAWSSGSKYKERDGYDSCSATATDSPATLGHRVSQKRGEQRANWHRHSKRSAAPDVAVPRWLWHKLEVIIDGSPSQASRPRSHVPKPAALGGSSRKPTSDVKVHAILDHWTERQNATQLWSLAHRRIFGLRRRSEISRESGYSVMLRCPPPLRCGRRMGAERGKDRRITSFSEMLRTNSCADRCLESCCTRVMLRWLSRV